MCTKIRYVPKATITQTRLSSPQGLRNRFYARQARQQTGYRTPQRNYGGMGQAQAYRLSARKNDQMAVEWESFVFDDIDSEDLIKRSRTNEDGRRNTVKRDAAVDDMHQILSNGPLETNDIDDKMAQFGHSKYAIRQARSQLQLVKVPRERNTDPHRWQLPEDQTGTFTIDNWER